MPALWGPEMGRAVMLRELAKDEEVTLLGSQLCQGLRDLFLFTTLNLISSTISPFISLSFSSFHVPLSLIVLGALVPGSLMLFSPLLAFLSWLYLSLPVFKQPFLDFYPRFYFFLHPPPFISALISFHLNCSNSISFLLTPTILHIYYLSPQQCLRMCLPLFIDVGLLLSQPVNCALDWGLFRCPGQCHCTVFEVSNMWVQNDYAHLKEYIISQL